MSTTCKLIDIIRNITILAAVCLILSGCSSFTVMTESPERAELETSLPSPLELRRTNWRILKQNDNVYFSLNTENFQNLTRNIEDLQNRLFLQRNIIIEQREFYKNKK